MEQTVLEGDADPRELAQLEETTRAKAVGDLDRLNESSNRYRTALTGQPAPAQAAPVAPDPYQEWVKRKGRDEIAAMESAGKSQVDALKKQADVTGPQYEKLAKDIEGTEFPAPPGRPKPIPVPTREQSINQTAAKSLFAIASVIGALGMMGGRGRGMLAMSGMTGMVQGFNEGNAEKYKASKDQYDEAVRQQLDQYHMAHQYYLDQVQNQKDGWAQRMLAINLKAREWGDQAMIAATEEANAEKVFHQVYEFEQMMNNFQKTLDTQSLFGDRQKLLQAQTGAAEALTEQRRASAQSIKDRKDKIATGTKNDLLGMLRANDARRKVLETEVAKQGGLFSDPDPDMLTELAQLNEERRQINAALQGKNLSTGAPGASGTPQGAGVPKRMVYDAQGNLVGQK